MAPLKLNQPTKSAEPSTAASQQSRREGMVRRRTELRSNLWPDFDPRQLWSSSRKRPGYTVVPRTMQLILTAMDTLSKGKSISSTYFDLWCRAPEEQFVSLSRPKEMAFYAGFNGERAERTWLDRIKILEGLGFLKIESGSSGRYSYALLLNPYHVLANRFEEGLLQKNLWNALVERVAEIGAVDLQDLEPKLETTKKKSSKKVAAATSL